MLVQAKAYLLLLMCLSMLCPAEMAAPEQAVRPPEQAMAYRSTHSVMILMNSGLASRIVLAVVLVEFLNVVALMRGILIRMAMVGLTVVMVVNRLFEGNMEQKMRLAVLAVYMVVVMVETPNLVGMVQMQLIMVLAAVVVPTIVIITPIPAMEGLAIKE